MEEFLWCDLSNGNSLAELLHHWCYWLICCIINWLELIECVGETCDVTILVKTSSTINYTNKYSFTFIHVLSIGLGRVLGVLHLNLTSCVWSLEKYPPTPPKKKQFNFFLCKTPRNKQHCGNVLSKRFYLNGNMTWFLPQIQKLKWQTVSPYNVI